MNPNQTAPYCLQYMLPKYVSRWEQTAFVSDWKRNNPYVYFVTLFSVTDQKHTFWCYRTMLSLCWLGINCKKNSPLSSWNINPQTDEELILSVRQIPCTEMSFLNLVPRLWHSHEHDWNLLDSLISNYKQIFTFPLRVFKWTFSFEMLFIASWTDLFKPLQQTCYLGGPTSTPSNNIVADVCLTLNVHRHGVKCRTLAF